MKNSLQYNTYNTNYADSNTKLWYKGNNDKDQRVQQQNKQLSV